MGVKTVDEAAAVDPGAVGGAAVSALHPGPLSPLTLARLRMRRGWRLLLATGAGMLVAVVLVCAVPLYTALIADIQLQRVLAGAPANQMNVEVQVTGIPLSPPDVGRLDARVAQLGQEIAAFAPATTSYVELGSTLQPIGVTPKTETLPGSGVIQPLVFDYARALPHMNVLAGRLPQETAAGQFPEVMVSSKMGLKPGDILTIDFPVQVMCGVGALSCGKGADRQPGLQNLAVRVVGTWFPKSLTDPFWNGRSFDTVSLPAVGKSPPPPPIFPVLFARTTFFSTFISPQPAATSPATGEQHVPIALHYLFYTEPTSITATNMDAVAARVTVFKRTITNAVYSNAGFTDLTGQGFPPESLSISTALDRLIDGLDEQFRVLAQPLYIVVAQVAALALLFVAAMAALLVETQGAEIATLKSRGAGTPQILASFALYGTALGAVAAAIGPFVAFALSLAVVRALVPGAASLGGPTLATGYLASTISPALVARPALLGAGLGLAVLLVSVWRAARLDVLAFRREQGRQTRVPFWRRYYLDVALAVVCAAGYVELGQFGGLNAREQLGQTQAQGPDPLLLAAPALLLLAGALLVLRLLPLGARLGATLMARGRGASAMLAFAQVARGAAQFTRLTLLLTLAVGLAIFALTFQSSLGANAADRAAFLAGGDQRAVLDESVIEQTLPLLAQFAHLPGVTAAMPAYRSFALNHGGAPTGVLAVDPSLFAQVAYWRADYASRPLASLMTGMRAHLQGQSAGDPNHPLWALVDSTFAAVGYLRPGDRFVLVPNNTGSPTGTLHFVVGGVVAYIPTMDDPTVAGNVLVDEQDYVTALNSPVLADEQINGPNEFWLRTTGSAQDAAARARLLQPPSLPVQSVTNRRQLEEQLRTEPLNAGMSGLLLAGALIAALLAALGTLVQSGASARLRLTQFAILRTLGVGRRQLVGMLLGQQLIVYLFGLLGGTALGVALATATLPFLAFSTSVANVAALRLPPSTLVFNIAALAIFYAALLAAFVLALLLAGRAALRVGLGRALRLGED